MNCVDFLMHHNMLHLCTGARSQGKIAHLNQFMFSSVKAPVIRCIHSHAFYIHIHRVLYSSAQLASSLTGVSRRTIILFHGQRRVQSINNQSQWWHRHAINVVQDFHLQRPVETVMVGRKRRRQNSRQTKQQVEVVQTCFRPRRARASTAK